MSYPGGKNGSGAAAAIINQIPPHTTWVTLFAGLCAVTLLKKPAQFNYVNDAAVATSIWWMDNKPKHNKDNHAWIITTGDALENQVWNYKPDQQRFIYLDPPYLPSTLKHPQRYQIKFDENDHIRLLELMLATTNNHRILIHGYESRLYNSMLINWRKAHYYTTNRAGLHVRETLWMNYDEPTELHDYRFLGRNYRDRERIKRKLNRWTAKFNKLPILEQQAILKILTQQEKEHDNN